MSMEPSGIEDAVMLDVTPVARQVDSLSRVQERGMGFVKILGKLPAHLEKSRLLAAKIEHFMALLNQIRIQASAKGSTFLQASTTEHLESLMNQFDAMGAGIEDILVLHITPFRSGRDALYDAWIRQYELEERVIELTKVCDEHLTRVNGDLARANRSRTQSFHVPLTIPPFHSNVPETPPSPPPQRNGLPLTTKERTLLHSVTTLLREECDLVDAPELDPVSAEIDSVDCCDDLVIFKIYDLLRIPYSLNATPQDLLEAVDSFDDDFRLDPPAPTFDPPDPARCFHIAGLLQRSHKLPASVVAWLLSLLAAELCQWELYPQAEAVGLWAFTSHMSVQQAEPTTGPSSLSSSSSTSSKRRHLQYNLALSHLNLARFKYMLGHFNDTLNFHINQGLALLQHFPDSGKQPKVQWTMTRAMRFLAMLDTNPPESLRTVKEAVGMYGDMMDEVEAWKEAMATATKKARAQAKSSISNRTESQSPTAPLHRHTPHQVIITPGSSSSKLRGLDRFEFHFANALYTLSSSCHVEKKYDDAIDAQKRALEQLQICYDHVPLDISLETMAHGYAYLSQDSLASTSITSEERIAWAGLAVDAYRKLMKTAKSYANSLRNALANYADLLEAKEDYEGALGLVLEMAELIQDHLIDGSNLGHTYDRIAWFHRLLKRYDDGLKYDRLAVQVYREEYRAPSKPEADALHNYAFDLAALDRYQEALVVEEQVWVYYASMNPDVMEGVEVDHKAIGDALTALASYQFQLSNERRGMDLAIEALAEYQHAYDNPGEEGVLPLEDILYCISITINNAISLTDDNEERGLSVGRLCVERVDMLCEAHPENDQVLEAFLEVQLSYGMVLSRQRKTEESIQWWRKSLGWYQNQNLEDAQSFVHVNYLETLLNLEDDLYDSGQLSNAKDILLQVRNEGMEFIDRHPALHVSVVYASFNYAQLLIDFEADYRGALEVTNETLELLESHPGHDPNTRAGSIVFVAHCISLMTRARALARLGRPEEGLEEIEKALDLIDRTPIKVIAKGWKFGPLCLPRSLAEQGVVLADLGREDEAYEVSVKAWDVLCKMKRAYTFQRSDIEVVEGECLQYLAEKHALKGDVEKAVVMFEDVIRTYRESAVTRAEMRSELALALRTIGALYCGLGRHEEGVAARKEYGALRQQLQGGLKDLDRLVQVGVEYDRVRPARVELVRRLGLECTHHYEEV